MAEGGKEYAKYELDAHGLKVEVVIADRGDFVPSYEVKILGLGGATKVLLVSLRQELLLMVPIDPTRIEDKEYLDELTNKYIGASTCRSTGTCRARRRRPRRYSYPT